MTMGTSFKGVIFDMDGVLVDSERLYMRFWREACAEYGFELTREMALSLRSNSPETAIPKFKAWFGEAADYHQIRALRRKLMAEYIDANGVELKEGAKEIIDHLHKSGLKIALATASPVKRARHYLQPHGLLEGFDAIISGAELKNSKPAPDIYLAAAEALGLSPAECVAVEDSPSGVIAAKTAGCFTVMIPDLTPADKEDLVYIDYLAENLSEIERLIRSSQPASDLL